MYSHFALLCTQVFVTWLRDNTSAPEILKSAAHCMSTPQLTIVLDAGVSLYAASRTQSMLRSAKQATSTTKRPVSLFEWREMTIPLT